MPVMQCGAVSHRGTDFAHHLVSTIIDYAAVADMSVFILFIDQVKAFDRIVREMVVGWADDLQGDHVEHLMSIGLSRASAEFLRVQALVKGCLVRGARRLRLLQLRQDAVKCREMR